MTSQESTFEGCPSQKKVRTAALAFLEHLASVCYLFALLLKARHRLTIGFLLPGLSFFLKSNKVVLGDGAFAEFAVALEQTIRSR